MTSNCKRYIIKAITLTVFFTFFSISASAFDNTLLSPQMRLYKKEAGLNIGLNYIQGGNPGYYDNNANPVAEKTLDFSTDDSLLFTPTGLLLFRDTLDKTDLLWDTEFYEIALSAGYGIGDFYLFAQLPLTIRDYSEKIVGVQYNQSIDNNLNIIRKAEFAYDLPSTTRFERIDLGIRWTFLETEDLKLFTMPTGTLALVDDNEDFFANIPSTISLPIGIDYSFGSTGLQGQAAYVLREGDMSEQLQIDATLYFTNVPNTALFLDVRYLQSFDETDEFIRYTVPIAPSYLTVAPGFSMLIAQNFDFFINFRVDLWNKSNYGMTGVNAGVNWMMDSQD